MLDDILMSFSRALEWGDKGQLRDAFSQGQIKSKQWLIDALSDHRYNLGTVFNLCNWYGVLPLMLFECGYFNIDKCVGFDSDPNATTVADELNHHILVDNWKYKSSCDDIMELDWDVTHYNVLRENLTVAPMIDMADTFINCACEHTSADWYSRIPTGKLVVLQSNNYDAEKTHINCDVSLDRFLDKYPVSETLYSGAYDFDIYSRWMLIGVT